MSPRSPDLPATLLAHAVAQGLEEVDVARLACCSRELRNRAYRAWPANPTTLFRAAKHGNAALLRLLLGGQLQGGTPEVNSTSEAGWAPLALASFRGHDAAVRVLLDAGADACWQHADGCSVLELAVESGSAAVVQALLAAGADISSGRKAPLLGIAAERGHRDVAELLLGAGADANSTRRCAMAPHGVLRPETVVRSSSPPPPPHHTPHPHPHLRAATVVKPLFCRWLSNVATWRWRSCCWRPARRLMV